MQYKVRITAAQVARSLGIEFKDELLQLDPAQPFLLKPLPPGEEVTEYITLGNGERFIRVPNIVTTTIQRGKRARVGQYCVWETRQEPYPAPSTAVRDFRVDVSERINYLVAQAERAARGWKPGWGALA